MVLIDIEDLPTTTLTVWRRRARAAGVPVRQYVRRELAASAARQAPIDAVVRFLAEERPEHSVAEFDVGSLALINVYNLPTEGWSVCNAPAAAAGMPLSDCVREELITSARRSTVDDAVLEICEAMSNDPDLHLDLDAVIASVCYARGSSDRSSDHQPGCSETTLVSTGQRIVRVSRLALAVAGAAVGISDPCPRATRPRWLSGKHVGGVGQDACDVTGNKIVWVCAGAEAVLAV
ncbi:hypothetical protein ACIA5E_18180 [Nocardia asteroides]|uniref:hypothetical protein n=1 Tax=Nocardia asteroides TaxID=1824 RepID=UPI0037B23E11